MDTKFKIGDFTLCKENAYAVNYDLPVFEINKLYKIDNLYKGRIIIKGENSRNVHIRTREFLKYFHTKIEMRKYKIQNINENL